MRLQRVRSPMNNLEKVEIVGAGLMGGTGRILKSELRKIYGK
jgi:hypothetical protein